MTNLDILRSGFCTSPSGPDGHSINIKFHSMAEKHAAFDALMALVNAAIKAPEMEDPIMIPRGLIGAACSAIDKQRPAEKLLAELREYTFGSKSGYKPSSELNAYHAAESQPAHAEPVHDFGVQS